MKPRANYAPYILRKPNDQTTVKCVQCLEERSPTEYHKHSIRLDGYVRYRQICKYCRKKKERNKSRPIHAQIISSGVQKCKYCHTVKPLEYFYANGCFSDGIKKYRARCKDCILIDRKNKFAETYKDKIRKKHSSAKNYISTLLNHCSKRKNKEYNLDIQYVLDIYENQNGLCSISGLRMTYEYGATATNISIDRIDSSKGYVKGNVHLVCYIVNVMKNQFSIQEFIEFAKKIVIYSQNKINAED